MTVFDCFSLVFFVSFVVPISCLRPKSGTGFLPCCIRRSAELSPISERPTALSIRGIDSPPLGTFRTSFEKSKKRSVRIFDIVRGHRYTGRELITTL